MDKFKLKLSDRLALLLSGTIAIISAAVIFWPGLLQSLFLQRDLDRVELGLVVNATNDVRRRTLGSYLWADLFQGAKVYANDSLFTGRSSTLKLSLFEQAEIKLNPNSLLYLDTKEGSSPILKLSLGGATFLLKKGKPLKISHKGKVYSVKTNQESTKLNVELNDNGSLKFQRKSKGNNLNINDEVINVQEGQALTLDDDKLHASPVTYKTPEYEEIWWLEKGENIKFLWKNTDKGQQRLQIATDAEFSDIVIDQTVSGQQFQVASPLDRDGDLFWRILTNDEVFELNSSSKFTVHLKKGPSPRFPVEIDLLSPVTDSYKVGFQWDEVSEVTKYELQVSSSKDFEDVIFQESVSKPYKYTKLPKGDFFWRVRISSKHPAKGIWGKSAQFSIKTPILKSQKSKVPKVSMNQDLTDLAKLRVVSAPNIHEKVIKTTLHYNGTRSVATGPLSLQLQNPPELKWQPVPGAEEYSIEIAKDKDFKEIIKTKTTTDTSFIWEEVTTGEYYWRSKALSDGSTSKASPAGRILVSLPTPKFLSRDIAKSITYKTTREYIAANPSVQLAWAENLGVSNYLVEVATDKKFTKIVDKHTTSKNNLKFVPDTGEAYFVRVGSLNSKRDLASVYSKPLEVKLKKTLEILAPELDSPLDNTILINLQGRPVQSIIFAWQDVENAQTYELQLAKDQDFKNKISTLNTSSTEYVMNLDQKGLIYWRVRGKQLKHKSKWSKIHKLQFK